MTIVASAPGKSILIGEHAAVYGRPALVAAVDRRLRVELEPVDGPPGVALELDGLGVREHVDWEALESYAEERRALWRRFDGSLVDPGADRGADRPSFDAVRGDDPAHVVKLALGLASAEARRDAGAGSDRGGDGGGRVRLRIESTLPVGAGFGSSAAAAVAVVRAVLALRSHPAPAETLHRLALDVERCQHGTPSGVDDSTVIHGGVVWAERVAGELTIERLEVDASPVLERLRVVDTGRPREETGTVVAAVRALRARDPLSFDARLDAMTEATRQLRREVESTAADDEAVVSSIRRFQSGLEALGVVPEPVSALVRRIEAAGGAAKISGAGALGGSGAGSLLVYHSDVEWLERTSVLDGVERLDLRFGAPGARLESRNRRPEPAP